MSSDSSARVEIGHAYRLFATGSPPGVPVGDCQIALRALGLDLNAKDMASVLPRGKKSVRPRRKKSSGSTATAAVSLSDDSDDMREVVRLNEAEFTACATAAIRLRGSAPRREVLAAFELFSGASEAITVAGLQSVAAELGDSLTPAELQEMVDEADSSGRGQRVSARDFADVLSKAGVLGEKKGRKRKA